jgi:hypothetical protein
MEKIASKMRKYKKGNVSTPPLPERVKVEASSDSPRQDVVYQKVTCPFSSRAGAPVYCNSGCALYRKNKVDGFNCPLTELDSMSWIMRGKPQRK